MKRFFAASIVAGAALTAGILAGSGVADSQTILRGTTARSAAPQGQPAPLFCPDGSYNSDGLCRPYSWAAGSVLISPLRPVIKLD
jgi:hypothetical protein